MAEIEDLRGMLKMWGNYEISENCLYLHDNSYLQDPELLKMLEIYHINKIQLNLFS